MTHPKLSISKEILTIMKKKMSQTNGFLKMVIITILKKRKVKEGKNECMSG
jgi:hypothetical protein